ncbi:MAG: hypothetical protein M0036_17965 [Desulfobacteraceae bacterium]|nr:hypothetical protein [Desulfobacteraceae bacterium]
MAAAFFLYKSPILVLLLNKLISTNIRTTALGPPITIKINQRRHRRIGPVNARRSGSQMNIGIQHRLLPDVAVNSFEPDLINIGETDEEWRAREAAMKLLVKSFRVVINCVARKG